VIDIPDHLLGETIDQGTLTVTRAMIREYAAGAGDQDTLAGACTVAPPTFVFSMRRALVPHVPLPPGTFAVFAGHDLVFHDVVRADHTYRMTARLTDVYEKSGRSGALTVIVRTALVATTAGEPVIEITERQIVRLRSPASALHGDVA
jgi:acyl dehydratase